VTYQATGTENDSGNAFTRTDTQNVSWTAGSCDSTAPTVTSITTADTNPTNTTGNLKWTVKFSENVMGVDTADFALTSSGLGGSPAISSVAQGANASEYTVTASSGSGTGKLGLNLNDNDSIKDAANNLLGGIGTGTAGGTEAGNGSFDGDDYVIDRTAPTMTGSAFKSPDFTDPYTADTWTNKDVRVTFTCADTGDSGLTSTSGNDVQNFTTETSGTTATSGGTCKDNAGNTAAASTFGPIKIDTTNPTINGSRTPAANSFGWNNGDVAVSFNCADSLSQIATCLGNTTLSSEGANQSVQGTATDNAGNSNTATMSGINIDLTDPTISVTLDPADPAASGWYNISTGAPTASYTCEDTLSGLDGTCPSPFTFGEGNNLSHSETVSDKAGNDATAEVNNIKVDLHAPSAPSATTNPASPVANSGDFFKDTVTVSYGGSTDVGPSGIAGYSNAETFNSTGTHNYSGKATDNAGNESTATTGSVKVDAVAPELTLSGCPTTPVTLNDTNKSISFSASDEANGSGLVGASSGSVSLETGSVGPKSKTVTVEDKVGHSTSKTCNYSVNYGFSGFLQPINMTAHQTGTDVSTFKAGSTVPVKFKLTDANGNVVQPASAPEWVTPLKGSSTNQAVDEDLYSLTATTGGTYRYDATAQQWIYNWSTKGTTAGCYYRIGVTLDDGKTYYQNISLR
jgi:large repetitive protein